MKKRLPLITGFLLLLAGAVCYRYEPPFIAGLSRRMFDPFLNVAARPVQTDSVAVIDIDDESLARYGQWPWPRTRLAELVSRLQENGAAVIAFDIIFIERDRTSPAELSNDWKEEFGADVQISGLSSNLWDFDAVFAGALARGSSVLGCFMNRSPVPLEELPAEEQSFYRGRFFEKGKPAHALLLQAGGSLQPFPELAEAAAGIAFINTEPDRDSIIRSTPLVLAYGPGRIYPSLAFEAVRLYTGAKKAGIIYDTLGVEGVQEIQILNRIIPTDARGRLAINFRSTRFPWYSAADVLGGKLDAGALQGKIVFIGTSAAALQDLVATPLTDEIPGVEVHATVVDNILAGDILCEPRWMPFVCLLFMLAGGLVVTLLVVYTPALISFLVMLIADIAVLSASAWLLQSKQLVVRPAEIITVWGLVFIGVIVVKYWQEERGRKKVRKMFGTMVSASVLKYIEQNPGSFSLTGIKAEVTVVFSDVAGFTEISETFAPARLAELLNRYLKPATEIIMARSGYVDKYEGDAIMAEWGVPFPMKDHAAQACYAALEQQEKVAEIRPQLEKEFGHALDVRIGINTGLVTAGNMGSEKRFQYTVMGDVVNQASRFESANKCYGSLIIIGEKTYAATYGLFETRLLDLIVVQGKTETVRIYELLARRGELDDAKRNVVVLYEEALKLHWERNFDEALARLDVALALMEDEPSHWLRQRISGYIENPPPEGWSGEFVNPEK